MAGTDPPKNLLLQELSRSVFGLKKQIEELRSEVESVNSELEEAKCLKETTEQELKSFEVELSLNEASIQVLEARIALVQDEISTIGSEIDELKNSITPATRRIYRSCYDCDKSRYGVSVLDMNLRTYEKTWKTDIHLKPRTCYHAGVLCFSPDLLGRPPEYRLQFDEEYLAKVYFKTRLKLDKERIENKPL
ncbi:hypothetical protein GQ457_02G011410 [Hibiscus cannabinus]